MLNPADAPPLGLNPADAPPPGLNPADAPPPGLNPADAPLLFDWTAFTGYDEERALHEALASLEGGKDR